MEFKANQVYDIKHLEKFFQFLLENEINAEGYNKYATLYRSKENFSFGVWKKIEHYEGMSSIHQGLTDHAKNSRGYEAVDLQDWIFNAFLLTKRIKTSRVNNFYKLQPMVLSPADKPFPERVGTLGIHELADIFNGFPIKFLKFGGRNGELFFELSPSSSNLFLSFDSSKNGEFLGWGDADELETVFDDIEIHLNELAIPFFKSFYKQHFKEWSGWLDEDEKSYFLKMLDKKLVRGLMPKEAGLFFTSWDLKRGEFFNRPELMFTVSSLDYALIHGTKVFYLNQVDKYVNSVFSTLVHHLDSDIRDRTGLSRGNDAQPDYDAWTLDAFEGDPSNYWNIE